ncbi:hypothetical protein NDU88_004953 [Pleurodeles waltl]|uniref:Uncharacterized protein n=1 Tax=Pleurodeles waltl TaxID=8319 RepID=A0AAV7SKE5_PLEWA|nr:hypothetical protein NDU88_004953 [Pleurodeles waltl]
MLGVWISRTPMGRLVEMPGNFRTSNPPTVKERVEIPRERQDRASLILTGETYPSDRIRTTHGIIRGTMSWDQDLLYLRSKLTDMEDRSRRDDIRLHGILENEEGSDIQAFLSSTLPKLTSLDFDPPLEFQRAHRIDPKRSGNSSRPRPIIAWLLQHNQTCQILQAARNHGPFQIDQHDIRITADYSKETNERRKAFLAL